MLEAGGPRKIVGFGNVLAVHRDDDVAAADRSVPGSRGSGSIVLPSSTTLAPSSPARIAIACSGSSKSKSSRRIPSRARARQATSAATRIDAFTLIDDAVIGEANRLGPFSRIRPGTTLARDVHVGNFVEIKNSQIDDGSKINHLSYVGDTTMGKKVNIGAGTITCNYDGANKHRTVIEDEVFVGSDTQLVAPITVGRGATLGAGTTLTRDAPAGELTLSRAKQLTINGWKRPVKQKKEG